MKKRMTSLLLTILLVALPVVFCQAATGSDESRLLCALTEVVECGALGECIELAAEDVGLPDFLIIDLKAKKILEATSVSLRESSFNVNTTQEGMTILSGVDGLRGWSAVLSAKNTRLSASVSDESAGFVVFGACRPE
jgi:hypothetical protein